MKGLVEFVVGIAVGAILTTIGLGHYAETVKHQLPEPDGKVIIDNEEWRWYDTNKAKQGPSPKCWISRRGVFYEETGIKLPSRRAPLERQDDQGSGDRAQEAPLRSGTVHDVRLKTCRCAPPNRL